MIAVHETLPAAPTTALWLNRILGPVVEACKFETPPPVELRPTGKWIGACPSSEFATDQRVELSSRLRFDSPRTLIKVYVHESCHRLLSRYEVDHHAAVFFCLQYALFSRVDRFQNPSPPGMAMAVTPTLYDLQDAPDPLAHLPRHVWLSRSITWAIKTAEEVDDGTQSAEKLTTQIVNKYQAWVVNLEREPELELQKNVAAAHALEAAQEAAEKWKKRAWIAAAVALVFMVF